MGKRLDGPEALRGIAALLVAINHAGFIAEYPSVASAVLHKSYLAVDLFFMLSGFVLARTYESRMPEPASFLLMRFRRLWPLIAAGVVIGALVVVQSPPPDHFALYLLAGLLILPVGGGVPLNGPAWSIFFELVANVMHALILHRTQTRVLVLIVAGCAAYLTATMTTRGLDLGQGQWFFAGFVRLAMSYIAGIALWRLFGDRPRCSAALGWLAIIAFPVMTVMAGEWGVPLAEPALVMVFGPLALLGSLAVEDCRVARDLGAFSFPLYALHFPIQKAAYLAGFGWVASAMLSIVLAAAVAIPLDSRWRRVVFARWQRNRAQAAPAV